MKYIVTGGARFVGSNLGDLLIDKVHDVDVIDNFSTYHNFDLSDYKEYEK